MKRSSMLNALFFAALFFLSTSVSYSVWHEGSTSQASAARNVAD